MEADQRDNGVTTAAPAGPKHIIRADDNDGNSSSCPGSTDRPSNTALSSLQSAPHIQEVRLGCKVGSASKRQSSSHKSLESGRSGSVDTPTSVRSEKTLKASGSGRNLKRMSDIAGAGSRRDSLTSSGKCSENASWEDLPAGTKRDNFSRASALASALEYAAGSARERTAQSTDGPNILYEDCLGLASDARNQSAAEAAKLDPLELDLSSGLAEVQIQRRRKKKDRTAEEQAEHDRLKAERREERRRRKEERRAAQRRGRSGVRTKFLIESLRSEMVLLQQQNAKLRRIVAVRLPGQSEEIFRYACRPDPVAVVQGSAESLAESFPGLDLDSLEEEEEEDSSVDNQEEGADECGNDKKGSSIVEQGSGMVDGDNIWNT